MADNIVQFTDPIDKVQPSEQGEEAAIRAGRLKGEFFRSMGQSADTAIRAYQETQGNEEISKAQPLYTATYFATLQQAKADLANRDPNDPSFAAQWGQTLQDRLDNLSNQFHSPKGYDYARQLHERFMNAGAEFITNAQGEMAGEAAVRNFQANIATNQALATSSPSQLDLALQGIDEGYQSIKGKAAGTADVRYMAQMDAEHAEARRTTIISALKTKMMQGGQGGIDEVRKDLTNPSYYKDDLLGPERVELQQFADEQEQRNTERQKAIQDNQDKQAAIEAKGQAVQLTTDITNAIVSGQGIPQSLLDRRDALVSNTHLAGLITGELNDVNTLIREGSKPTTADEYQPSNPRAMSGFLSRVGIPAGSPGALTEADLILALKRDHTISKEDYGILHEALGKTQSNPGFKAAQETVMRYIKTMTPLIERGGNPGGSIRVGGATAVAAFTSDMWRKFAEWSESEDPGTAADILTNPSNPKSFQATGMIHAYAQSAGQQDTIGWLRKNVHGYSDFEGGGNGAPVIDTLGGSVRTDGGGTQPAASGGGPDLAAMRKVLGK